jgi:hypothetical protein
LSIFEKCPPRFEIFIHHRYYKLFCSISPKLFNSSCQLVFLFPDFL